MPRMAGRVVSISGRAAPTPRPSTPVRGSKGIRERYGMDPEIRYFHTAAVTDNSVDAVLLTAAAE